MPEIQLLLRRNTTCLTPERERDQGVGCASTRPSGRLRRAAFWRRSLPRSAWARACSLTSTRTWACSPRTGLVAMAMDLAGFWHDRLADGIPFSLSLWESSRRMSWDITCCAVRRGVLRHAAIFYSSPPPIGPNGVRSSASGRLCRAGLLV